jgi:hypothetical protein
MVDGYGEREKLRRPGVRSGTELILEVVTSAPRATWPPTLMRPSGIHQWSLFGNGWRCDIFANKTLCAFGSEPGAVLAGQEQPASRGCGMIVLAPQIDEERRSQAADHAQCAASGAVDSSGRRKLSGAASVASRAEESVVPEERQQNNDGKRDTQQPQQQATTETHVCLLSAIVNAPRTGLPAVAAGSQDARLSCQQNQQDDDRNGNAQQPQENRHCMLLRRQLTTAGGQGGDRSMPRPAAGRLRPPQGWRRMRRTGARRSSRKRAWLPRCGRDRRRLSPRRSRR